MVAFFVLQTLMVILMQLGVVRWFNLRSLLNQIATLVLCNLFFVFLLACVSLPCWAFNNF